MMTVVCVLTIAATAGAQFPGASREHKLLKMEDGDWDAVVTMFMGPTGPYDPPVKSKAKESNRLLGDLWVVSDFKGDFAGMPFTGHAQLGYDPLEKKYVGTWIDSFTPGITTMSGTYDPNTKTMTFDTSTVGMDGKPAKGKNVVVYSDNKRVMTMYMTAPGSDEMVKTMQIEYTRAK